MPNKYPSNKRLWRVGRDLDGYYFEIKLGGMVVDRFDIDEQTVQMLRREGVVKD